MEFGEVAKMKRAKEDGTRMLVTDECLAAGRERVGYSAMGGY